MNSLVLKNLKRTAQAATVGWDDVQINTMGGLVSTRLAADFLAAANPNTILDLINALERSQARVCDLDLENIELKYRLKDLNDSLLDD